MTLLDYPGTIACTIFTGGCNLRCPFCHNAGLVRTPASVPNMEQDVLAYLAQRKGLLDGVCITGGERREYILGVGFGIGFGFGIGIGFGIAIFAMACHRLPSFAMICHDLL